MQTTLISWFIQLALYKWMSFSYAQKAFVIFIVLVILIAGALFLIEWFAKPSNERHIEGVRVVTEKNLASRTRSKKSKSRQQQIMLGSVPCPENLFDRHFLISGTTGVGKSTLIKLIIRQLRDSRRRAIIIDLNGEFCTAFKTSKDLIFNPLDLNGIKWNPLAEIRSVSDIDLVLKAILPTGISDDEEGWRQSARQFMRVLMLRLREAGELNIQRLRYLALESGDKELASFLQDGNHPVRLQSNQMMSTVKSIVQNCINNIALAPVESNFLISDWVRNRNGFIFITPQDKELEALSPLISIFINLSLAEMLSSSVGKRYAPMALIVDELASFDLDKFEASLEKGRKFGLVAFAGVQTIAQLHKKFGSLGASILLACFRTKIIFNPGDSETAERMSKEIGSQVVERREVSSSSSQGRSSRTTSWRRETRQAVTADTLRALPDLHAFIKFGGDYPVARIKIEPSASK